MQTARVSCKSLFIGVVLAMFAGAWGAAAADTVRKPVVAGQWYPDDPAALGRMIDALTRQAESADVPIPDSARLRALILPHAGFRFSGLTAAHSARVVQPHRFAKVVVMGPDHRVGFRNAAISAVDAYETPLGRIELHADAALLRQSSDLFAAVAASDRSEHSLEAVLPFLQRYLDDFELVPIVLGPCDPAAIINALQPRIDSDTLVVVSSDLSHFLSYPDAVREDRNTTAQICRLDAAGIRDRRNCACGKNPILVLLELARRNRWQPLLLHYSNSGDSGGGRDRVVGYASIAFFEDSPGLSATAPLTTADGRRLLSLARRAIAAQLGRIKADSGDDFAHLAQDDRFTRRCGTFVTLKSAGRLRGCIGNIEPDKPLVQGIRDNAVNAAFRDPRFPPLSEAEWEQVRVSISILSPPRALDYQNGGDLCTRLRPGVDGVIVRYDRRNATFLPQVWEELPVPAQFLSQLCRKAGLPADAWQHMPLEVYTYQVQHFSE
ncbi:MAG TPA: AmmeMemoRadiSam system protein B [Desulfobacterales bacterium]